MLVELKVLIRNYAPPTSRLVGECWSQLIPVVKLLYRVMDNRL